MAVGWAYLSMYSTEGKCPYLPLSGTPSDYMSPWILYKADMIDLLCCGILYVIDPLKYTINKKNQARKETEHIMSAHSQILTYFIHKLICLLPENTKCMYNECHSTYGV